MPAAAAAHEGWRPSANGYIEVSRQLDVQVGPTGGSSETSRELTRAIIWFSAGSLKWWNPDGTLTLTASMPDPTNSFADVTGDYTDHETWAKVDGSTCAIDWSGHPALHQAPVGVSMAHMAFSPTTGAATATQGLSVVGWPGTLPQLDPNLTGSDGCNGGTTSTHIFNWDGALLDQQYSLALDPATGDVNVAWDHTADESDTGYTRTVHSIVNANLHVAGLKEYIAAGKP